MKIFIAEDDINIVRILETIVEDRGLGSIEGYAENGNDAIKHIRTTRPDIVLVDLLMPGKDGIALVSEIKKDMPETQFIMISQVSSKDMIAKAYEKGVSYYIHKPINAVEIETIIGKVKDELEMNRTFSQIRKFLDWRKPKKESNKNKCIENHLEKRINQLMKDIGIIGEVGSFDIVKIIKFLIESNNTMNDYTLKELCSKFSNTPKTIEQRIRRTAITAMTNIANMGVEDYFNDRFTEYSNVLFNFEQIKREMDFVRGKASKGGTVNLRKFIDGILFHVK